MSPVSKLAGSASLNLLPSAVMPVFQSHALQTLGRLAATMSLFVVLAGKTVHQHQECGCGDDHCSVEQTSKPVKPCPYGCQHHDNTSSDAGHKSEQDGKPKHEEHLCPVCSLLAQAPEKTSLVDVPQSSEVILETILICSDVPVDGLILSARSRGPPAAV